MDSNRKMFADSLREFAAFIESHEDVPLPVMPRFDTFFYAKEDFQNAVKAVGGELEKKGDYGSLMVVRRTFGPLQFDLNIDREQVCERVVTGTRKVEAVTIPEHEEEIVEWKCKPILKQEVENAAV